MTVKLRPARDTAANWTAANPTLALGQKGYETDTKKTKTGTGATAWTSLAYDPFGDVTGQSSSVDSEVALFSGTGGKTIKRATATGIPILASGVQGTIFSALLASTQTTSNSTTDTTHWTPANVAAAALVSGQTLFQVRLVGNFDNKATSGTFTGRLKINGTTLLTVPIAVSQAGASTVTPWSVDFDVAVETSGGSGVVSGYGVASVITASGGGRNALPQSALAQVFNLSGGLQFTWTVQMATADAANITRTWRGNIFQRS